MMGMLAKIGLVSPYHDRSVHRSGRWVTVRRMWLLGHPDCAFCGTKEDIDVHHCLPLDFGGQELSMANLITLCRVHHLWCGHLGNWRSFNPHVRADAKWWYARIVSRPAPGSDPKAAGWVE